MLDEIKDSIKAKLYDFAYTPFMSSMLISWVMLNHKYLLIYFADFDLDKRLALLNTHDFVFHFHGYYLPYADNFIFPIIFGLFYVYGYPRISKEFYEYTLERTKELKAIKQSIEDETPLTQAEAREIRKLASTLEEEKDKAHESLRKKDEDCKNKLQDAIGSLNVKSQQLKNELDGAHSTIVNIQADRDNLNNQFIQANKSLDSKNDKAIALQAKIDQLEEQLKTIGVVNGTAIVKPLGSESKINQPNYYPIFKYLHDDYDQMSELQLIESLSNKTKIGRIVVRKAINDLLEEKIIEKDSNGYIQITKEGIEKIIKRVEEGEVPF